MAQYVSWWTVPCTEGASLGEVCSVYLGQRHSDFTNLVYALIFFCITALSVIDGRMLKPVGNDFTLTELLTVLVPQFLFWSHYCQVQGIYNVCIFLLYWFFHHCEMLIFTFGNVLNSWRLFCLIELFFFAWGIFFHSFIFYISISIYLRLSLVG